MMSSVSHFVFVHAAIIAGAAAFIVAARRMARAQNAWRGSRLDRIAATERARQGDLADLRQTQNNLRAAISSMRKKYQLISMIARTLSIERGCRDLGAFLKEDAPDISGCMVLLCGGRRFVYDAAADDFQEDSSGSADPGGGTPLMYGDRRIGSIDLSLPADLLATYAGQVQLTFATAILYEEARARAITDSLTGAAVRGYFDDRLKQDLSFAELSGRPLGLLMIDIDHFKKINDAHGHPAGDEVLKAVSAALIRSCRELDLVARYGGEEFAVIAPNITRDDLRAMAERIRGIISALAVTTAAGGAPIPVTISVGGAMWEPGATSDGARLIAAADRNLYAAKHAGRNRVEIESHTSS